MLHLKRLSLKQALYGVCLFLLASSAGMWAWNTLAELFGWPHMLYKHVLAMVVLFVLVRWMFWVPRHPGERFSLMLPDRTESQ